MAKLPKEDEVREGLKRLTQNKSRFYYEEIERKERSLRSAKAMIDVTGSLGVWGIKQ